MFRQLIRNKKQIKTTCACLDVKTSHFHTSKCSRDDKIPPEFENPIHRVGRIIKNDMITFREKLQFWKEPPPPLNEYGCTQPKDFPAHCDVVIIGGGAVGSSIAYWLKKRALQGLNVVVVERDPTYEKASTVLSVGGLRQQFSLEENIQMSLHGAEFLRNINNYLGIKGQAPVDVQFHPYGYLFLATEAGAKTLEKNSKLQISLGAKNELLSPEQLKRKFPWINTDGIALGCHGLENEGWFDPWTLLFSLKRKAISLGAHFVHAEAKAFQYRNFDDLMVSGMEQGTYQGLDQLIVKTHDGQMRRIKFAIAIIAAGAFSGEVARMARIGTGEGVLSVPLPVEPRKRYVYCFHSPDGPGLNTPMAIDPSGTYFRREGLAGHYICGRSPEFEEEPSVENLDVDHEFFNEKIWPILANRVKNFENLKVKSSWAGYYEYNNFDENGIIGPHPYYNNLYIATGFSGHGIQQSPAVGRAIAELILDSKFTAIDLTRLGFDRLVTLEPVREVHIV